MRVGLKVLAVFAVLLVLSIPLLMLQSLVRERSARADQVAAEIAASSTTTQTLHGPTWRRQLFITTIPAKPDATPEKPRRESQTRSADRAEISGKIGTTVRRRSLFEVRGFAGQVTLDAQFTASDQWLHGESEAREVRSVAGHWFEIGVSDLRGVDSVVATVNGLPAQAEPIASGGPSGESRLRIMWPTAALEALRGAGESVDLHVEIALRGTDRLMFAPGARDTRVSLEADWPHPSFLGRLLPTSSTIDSQGFKAQWIVSGFASAALAAEGQMAEARGCGPVAVECGGAGFGVALIEPVDHYGRVLRAVKYAQLLMLLLFGAVFVAELSARRPVHPVQYALVGAAQAVFYLLLLSLSEHLRFLPSYLLASFASIGLIAFYLRHALGSLRRGIAFAVGLGVVHAAVYGLLIAEDYALLAGSVLLFAALAAAMIATRHIDWYGTATRPAPAAEQP